MASSNRRVRHALVSWETKDEELDTWVSHLAHQGEIVDTSVIPKKRLALLEQENAFEDDVPVDLPDELNYVDDGLGNMVPIHLGEDGNVLPEAPVSLDDGFSREHNFDELVSWIGSPGVTVPVVTARIRENPEMAEEIGQAEDESAGKQNREVRAGIMNEVAKHGA